MLLWSVHGPVLKTDHGTFAMRYAGHGRSAPGRCNIIGSTRRAIATNGGGDALQALPSINYIYADEKGNIGYVYNGQFPVREGRDRLESRSCPATGPI